MAAGGFSRDQRSLLVTAANLICKDHVRIARASGWNKKVIFLHFSLLQPSARFEDIERLVSDSSCQDGFYTLATQVSL